MPEDEYKKILFRFYSDVLEEDTVETMWAIIVDEKKGLYRLDNIPIYAPLIACDDIIFAEYDEDETMLTYRHTVTPSGNSTVQVVIMDDTDIEQVRNELKDLGCKSEKMNSVYFAMNIPAAVDYGPVKARLEELEQQEIVGYSEPCLSDGHYPY
ncbi:DUF4265 domain-containing protein [Mucilaginibacter sp.]|uniref:DUF4265 domain-containing protein n=1 Tax=Mucilaginibacter sp. TaxID=1882438 RepID=UPI003264E22B